MQNQIFPLNVDPESPLNQINKKKKPTFKKWFNERKRMLGLVFGVCLVTVGVIVYPFLNLQLGKGQMTTLGEIMLESINIQTTDSPIVGDEFTVTAEAGADYCGYKMGMKMNGGDIIELQQDGCNYSYTGPFSEAGSIQIQTGWIAESGSFNVYDDTTIEVSPKLEISNVKITLESGSQKELSKSEMTEVVVGDEITKVSWEETPETCEYIKSKNYEYYVALNGPNGPNGPAVATISSTDDECDGGEKIISTSFLLDSNKPDGWDYLLQVGYIVGETQHAFGLFTIDTLGAYETPSEPVETATTEVIEVTAKGAVNDLMIRHMIRNVKISKPKTVYAGNEIELYWVESPLECSAYRLSETPQTRNVDIVDVSTGNIEGSFNVELYNPPECEVYPEEWLPIKVTIKTKNAGQKYLQVGYKAKENNGYTKLWDTSLSQITVEPLNTVDLSDIEQTGVYTIVPDRRIIDPTSQEDTTSSTSLFTATPSTINFADTQKPPIKFDYNIQNLPSNATVKIIIKNKDTSSVYATFIPNPVTLTGSLEWKGNKITCVSTICTETEVYEPGNYFAYIIATIRNPMAAGRTTTFYQSGDVPLTLKSTLPTTLSLSASPSLRQVEDQPVTFTLTVTGEASTCTIYYGDDTPPKTSPCTSATPGTFTHTYTTPGPYTVNATTDDNIIASIPSYTITTATTPITTPELVLINLEPDPDDDIEIDEDVEFKLKVENGTADTYKYTVNWDDDEDDYKKTIASSTSGTISHSYEKKGTYKIEACVLMTYSDKPTETICADDVKYTVVEDSSTETDKKENCTNDKDDDGDGDVDYEDSDCDIPASQEIVLSGVQITKSKFNPNVNATDIIYNLNRDAKVTVEILNTSKKTVVTLLDNRLLKAKNTAGTILSQSVWFYGTVDNKVGSQTLADGAYTYKITAVNPNYETISASKEGPVIIDSMDLSSGDPEDRTTNTTGTTVGTTTTTTATKTPLNTTTSTSTNLAALTMQNAPPSSTAGTGPEMLIYLVLPAISALVLTRKK